MDKQRVVVIVPLVIMVIVASVLFVDVAVADEVVQEEGTDEVPQVQEEGTDGGGLVEEDGTEDVELVEGDGTVTTNIYGGHPGVYAPHHMYFWQVNRISCGAFIINDRWVGTAAHCIIDDNGEMITDMTLVNRVNVPYNPLLATPHPNYNNQEKPYYKDTFDFALVKTTTTIIFIPTFCSPIPISSTWIAAGVNARAYGNGENAVSPWSPVLQAMDTTTINNLQCYSAYGNGIPFLTEPEILCTANQPNQGTARGDSGSSLVVRGSLLNLTAIGCVKGGVEPEKNKPSIFMRLSRFCPWILNVTGTACVP